MGIDLQQARHIADFLRRDRTLRDFEIEGESVSHGSVDYQIAFLSILQKSDQRIAEARSHAIDRVKEEFGIELTDEMIRFGGVTRKLEKERTRGEETRTRGL